KTDRTSRAKTQGYRSLRSSDVRRSFFRFAQRFACASFLSEPRVVRGLCDELRRERESVFAHTLSKNVPASRCWRRGRRDRRGHVCPIPTDLRSPACDL